MHDNIYKKNLIYYLKLRKGVIFVIISIIVVIIIYFWHGSRTAANQLTQDPDRGRDEREWDRPAQRRHIYDNGHS